MEINVNEDVDHLTQAGHKALAEGKIDEACVHFDKAASMASRIKEGFTERACFFNLGACCVAQGSPKKGLEYLKKALPPDRDTDGSANYADLHYNLGIAYDGLSQLQLSIECYETAFLEYKTLNNQEMQAETLQKLAVGCSTNGELAKAAKYYGEAAEAFRSLGDKTNQVLALTSRASLLGEVKDIDNCAETLRSVIELCEQLTDRTLQGELGNRSAEGQTACNMGFAYSQLRSFDHAIVKFLQAIQSSKDTNDQCSHWQASEGLAAVYFLKGNYKKAVQHYKVALSSLSASGAMMPEHNERIVNKLADAMKFLLTQGDSGTKKKSMIRQRPRRVDDETVEGDRPRRVGRTRTRSDANHRLIARGLDGGFDQATEDSDSHGSSVESGTGSDESEGDKKKGRYISPSWEQKKAANTLKVGPSPELLLSGPYQNLIRNRNGSDINDGYEEPVDDNIRSSSLFDFAPEMPRAHREAYLASIAASTSTPKKAEPPPVIYESSTRQTSKTCIIQ
ncbi:hypothetical protein QZH41_013639 [Actinostola sp. cb2023]|nr:hypothetical protein QZH41_013639 [Actinostola sp. cb2023]